MREALTTALRGLRLLFLFAALVVIGRIGYYEWRRAGLNAAGMPEMDRMTGTRFVEPLSRNGLEFEATCDVCRTTRHFWSNR